MILSILGVAFLGVAGAQGAEPVQAPDLQDEIQRAVNAQSEAEWRNALDALRAAGGEEHGELIRQLFRLAREATSTREAMAFGVIREALSIPDSDVVNALEPLLETADDTRRAALRSVLSESEDHSPGGNPAQPAVDDAVLRTAWGAPNLNGVWDFRTLTPFERPESLAGQTVFTPEEAAQFEAERLAAFAARDDQEPADGVGNYNQFWFDRGNKVSETRQTSLVIDPPDGRLPPFSAEATARQEAQRTARDGVNRHSPTPGGWVEDLGPGGVAVRCILGFNSGPPMTPGGYNQNLQVFQTQDHVVLLNEMVHSSRVIPLDGRPHLDDGLRQWMGDSRGRWEGDTLVVETTNFLGETSFQGGVTTADLHLVERFTRVSEGTLMYQVTVNDPNAWDRPWSYQIPMVKNDQPLYEYACHEGNYGLRNILTGAVVQQAGGDGAESGR